MQQKPVLEKSTSHYLLLVSKAETESKGWSILGLKYRPTHSLFAFLNYLQNDPIWVRN